MDEKQLQYEFLSILSESHPGLTFEEYRDSCVFLLFYQYLCLKHGDSLEEAYKPGELVKMAIRGKSHAPRTNARIAMTTPIRTETLPQRGLDRFIKIATFQI